MKKTARIRFAVIAAAALLALSGCSRSSGDRSVQQTLPKQETRQETAAVTQRQTEEAEAVPETEDIVTEAPAEEETTEAAEETSTQEPSTAEPTEAPAESLAIDTHWYVNADTLNLRQGPSTETAVVDKLYRGEEVLILGLEGDWANVFYHTGNTGYINVNYLVNTRAAAMEGAPVSAPDSSGGASSSDTQPAASAGHIVCIDAGHQAYGISETEPNGPGSAVMKAKLTTGTSGVVTGAAERDLNLTIALGLQQELTARGYQVVMIRTTNDCTLSNKERAEVANSSGAEVFLRIHANSSDNPEVSGAMFYAPSPANPYMSADLINASNALSQTLLTVFCQTTGAVNRGLLQDDTMTGINWCQVPVTIAEMGFMSNPDEDVRMQDPAYQALMVKGFADGIDTYFGRR